MAQVSIRIDDDVKAEADILFSELGLNMTTAFNMFIRQSLRDNGLPFMPRIATPNATTLAAMEEVEEMIRTKSGKSYSNMDDLLAELNS